MINFPNSPNVNDFYVDENQKNWQFNGVKWVPVNVFNPSVAFGSITTVFKSWVLKNSNYYAAAGDRIMADTTTNSFLILLPPSPVVGDEVTIADARGTWEFNRLTIDPLSKTINDVQEFLICDISNFKLTLIYNGSTWKVFS